MEHTINQTTTTLQLTDLSTDQLATLCGHEHDTLRRIEACFGVHILGAIGDWKISGERCQQAANALTTMTVQVRAGEPLPPEDVEQIMHASTTQPPAEASEDSSLPRGEQQGQTEALVLDAGRRQVRGKSPNQRHYLAMIHSNTLTLSMGPAGSGKSWLAVASAVSDLLSGQVERIILTRPAVEAGERLGFLPGDLQQKVDPYLRPLFDALIDMLGSDRMAKFQEDGRIEIAPLAYMRGRTLNDAFVILDEAQNTTRTQMKMFLTRLGFGSKMVVTGDISQIDLPKKSHSGLLHALQVLEHIDDVAICRMDRCDVVRHRLVADIVGAYDNHDD
ncbi:MAG: PhoH family protein [Mariprofundales bacterium]|nr:PhoH family protein [Mariprofundales bacterium]